MAKKQAKKSASRAAKDADRLTEGAVAKFLGYDDPPAKPKFQQGDFVRIIEIGPDPDSWFVRKYAPKEEGTPDGHTGDSELVYVEEISPASEDDAEEAYIDDPDSSAATSFYNEATPAPKLPRTKRGRPAKAESAIPVSESVKPESVKPETTTSMSTKKAIVKKAASKPAKSAPAASSSKKAVLGSGTKKKTAAKKVATKKKEVAAPIVIKDSKSVTEALKGHSPLEAIRTIEKRTSMNRWTLGGILSKVKREKLFLKVGSGKDAVTYEDSLDGFNKWCEEQTSTGSRVAAQLIANYEHFSPMGLDEEKISQIPWHKLKELVHVVENAQQADKWLDKASEMTRESLHTEVVKARVDAGKHVPRRGPGRGSDSMEKITFKLFNDQASTVHKALSKAKKKCDSKDPTDSEALVLIVTEWVAQC